MDRCCKIWSCSSSWRCCLHICNCYTKATLSYLDRVIVSSTTSTICSCDVDQSSIEIMEEMEKCKDSASLKRQILAEEKEHCGAVHFSSPLLFSSLSLLSFPFFLPFAASTLSSAGTWELLRLREIFQKD
ncbi:hypothetical protein Scep_004532 [Stephania cephalantha]|uniref:Uncharacterized protein n=1 Tax=Stephania cephalantha TaxID=152367 RepID=A0AAP0PVI3_9MAGN